MVTATDSRTHTCYDHVISLGATCQPAWQLRKNHLRRASYPLDWINSRTTGSVCELLSTGFEDFFEKSYLQPPESGNSRNELGFRHSKFGLVFWHEFESRRDFEERFEHRQNVYRRRIARLLQVLRGEATVLLVRFRVIRVDAEQIARTLQHEFPRLKFTLLALDDTSEIREDWGLSHVVNRHIECAPNGDATNAEFDHNWSDLFKTFNISRAHRFSRFRWRFRKRKLSFLD